MPQDVGGQGAIEGFSIVDNVIRGTVASINLSAYVPAWLTAPNISKTYDAVISNNSLYSIWTNSVIDLSGGTYGLVQTVSVQGNSVLGAGTGVIQSDAHTSAVNSANNAL